MDANETYQAARERARHHLREIESILAAHAERQAKDHENWAHVGYVKLVVDGLGDLIEAMGMKKEAPR